MSGPPISDARYARMSRLGREAVIVTDWTPLHVPRHNETGAFVAPWEWYVSTERTTA